MEIKIMMVFKNGEAPKYKYELTAYYPNNDPCPCSVYILDTDDLKEVEDAVNEHQERMQTEFHLLEYLEGVGRDAKTLRYKLPYEGICKKDHKPWLEGENNISA
jgi:hypothetical protein